MAMVMLGPVTRWACVWGGELKREVEGGDGGEDGGSAERGGGHAAVPADGVEPHEDDEDGEGEGGEPGEAGGGVGESEDGHSRGDEGREESEEPPVAREPVGVPGHRPHCSGGKAEGCGRDGGWGSPGFAALIAGLAEALAARWSVALWLRGGEPRLRGRGYWEEMARAFSACM